MIEEKIGKVIKGLGGLYEMRIANGADSHTLSCRAKGALHRDEEKVLVGDNVRITIDTETPDGVCLSSGSVVRRPARTTLLRFRLDILNLPLP